VAPTGLTWADLKVGTLVENHGDLLLVLAADSSVVTLLVVVAGESVAMSEGQLEHWETAAIGWQRVLKWCVIACEAP
jgi:hypothetical protein